MGERVYWGGSADAAGPAVLNGFLAEFELVAAAGEVAFELAEGLVLLVADAGDGQVQRLADLGDGPAAGPELDDPVLTRGEDGLSGGFEDLARVPGGRGGVGRGRDRG